MGLNSFMFQTVGHQLVDSLAECVGVPLYKRVIAGASANRSLFYYRVPAPATRELAATGAVALPPLDGDNSSSHRSHPPPQSQTVESDAASTTHASAASASAAADSTAS